MGKSLTNEEFLEKIQKVNPSIEIISEYKGCKEPIKCKCNICGYSWSSIPIYLIRGNGCKICGQKRANEIKSKSHNEYTQELTTKFPDIHLTSSYTGAKNKVKYHCNICNSDGELRASILLQKGCHTCRENKFKDGIRSGDNSLASKRPDLLIYLKNQSDARYLCGSDKKVSMVCPYCHTESMKIISNIVKQGFSCPICSDKISYPNKVIRALMNQIHTDYLCYEYSPEWIKPMRYDCYFEINNKKYVIEMDGKWHYTDNSLSGQTYQKSHEIDEYKIQVALDNDVQVIHINCYYSDFKFIKNNIIHSKLSDIYDLSSIDWVECETMIQNQLIKDVCEYYNTHSNMSCKEIGQVFKLSKETIRRYIKIGEKFDWCIYDYEKAKKIGAEKSAHAKRKPVNVYNDKSELIYNFNSIKQCMSYMSEKYDTVFRFNNIKNSDINNVLYKGFYFKVLSKEGDNYGDISQAR